MLIGVDEAGRGCVIGPMVIAAAQIESMKEFELKELGVKDSKKLSASRREELYPQVKKLCKLHTIHVSAKELTDMMDTMNLNEIEAVKIAQLLSHSPEGSLAYVDSPDNIPSHFADRIRPRLKHQLRLICENKADDKHLIVGAASIVAKVERDREIERIKEELGVDFNSGYTSDPYTTAFLAKHGSEEKVQIYLRHKWATLANLKQRKMTEF